MCSGGPAPYANCMKGSSAGARSFTTANMAVQLLKLKAFFMSTENTAKPSASADDRLYTTVLVPPRVPTHRCQAPPNTSAVLTQGAHRREAVSGLPHDDWPCAAG